MASGWRRRPYTLAMAVESSAAPLDDEETWRERWVAKLVAVVVFVALVAASLLVFRELTTPAPTPPSDAYVRSHHGQLYQGAYLGGNVGPCLDCTGFGSMVFVQYHGIEWQCWSGISKTGRDWECEPH